MGSEPTDDPDGIDGIIIRGGTGGGFGWVGWKRALGW